MSQVAKQGQKALVVLGCRVLGNRPSRALERRLAQALEVAKTANPDPVVLSGGRSWDGHVEAVAMGIYWSERTGQPALLETESLNTLENAKNVARLLRDRGVDQVLLVTSDFHMRRAAQLFRQQGLQVTAFPADSGLPLMARWKMGLREWGARGLQWWLR